MAKRMSESKAHIPHFSYFEQVDATRLIQLRGNVKRQADNEGLQVTYVPFILRALSLCITKYPLLNSSYAETEQKIIVHHQHNIGIAVSTPHGLIVPVIKGVQEMTLEQIIRTYNLLVYNAQHNKLSPNDMKGSTITLSNYGGIVKGGLWATPIINYPEAAILALARIHKQPIEKNGELVIRDVLNLSWSFDHRIIDGDLAARISHLLAQLLQDPAALL
jgi:pyruvate dehydrogenase E2 component (dihydrolipoamide acetyltransferase)/2-oxoisovalerate dehydrogenase E2 component (dihydrolipoyl transacylase)